MRNHFLRVRDVQRLVGLGSSEAQYTASAYAQLATVMRSERLDFVQLNYSVDYRAAEDWLLPLAAECGGAVLVNMRFGGGRLPYRLSGRLLSDWATEISAASWAQLTSPQILGRRHTAESAEGSQ